MKKQPNILFILSDDQGAWAMHCAGTPELITPSLDRLASEGMMLTSFFCASPVCSPARASLLTGRMPSAHGIHDWLRSGNLSAEVCAGLDNPYSNADEREPIAYLDGIPAFTDELARAGYTCALSGKWHMGDSMTPQHGFSRWYTIGKGGCCYYHPDVIEDGRISMRHGEYVTDLFTDNALKYLDELAARPEPFFLSVNYTAPHAPWGEEHHPRKYLDMYRNCDFASIPDVPDHENMTTGPVYGTPRRRENLTGYFAAITAMDAGIGRLLDRLDELGIAEDTLVIFTADNGMSMGHHGIWGKGNGTWPMNMYDTAVKVPFIARMKGIAPGTRRDEPVSACDLFPTLCELAGVTPAPDPMRPGVSFLPLLRGEPGGDRCAIVYDEYGPTRMIRTQRFKYVHRFCYGPNELYDMQADPGEEHNLYGQPEYDDTVLELRTRMLRWFDEHTVPELNGAREPVTGSGQFGRAGSTAGRMDNYAPAPRVTTPPRK